MPLPDDHDAELEQVAFLISKGSAQKDIARQLKMSPSKVSRLAKRAVDDGILVTQNPLLTLRREDINRIESELHHSARLVALLRKASGDRCNHVEVVYPRSSQRDNESYVREVAAGAARFLVTEILPGMSDVGLTWGVGLRELCRELATMIQREPKSSMLSRELKFHQCTGDVRAAIDDPSRRAGNLVAELNHVLGTRGHTFSVHASIPKSFDNEIPTIRSFFASMAGYSNMFALTEDYAVELKADLDAIITGCGDGTEADHWRDECADAAGIEPDALSGMVVGNVGGTWIAKSPEYEDRIAEINFRWNGVSVADLRRTVKRGRQVILVAAEATKAPVVARAVELGYVSTLIASVDLVQEMIRQVKPAGL